MKIKDYRLIFESTGRSEHIDMDVIGISEYDYVSFGSDFGIIWGQQFCSDEQEVTKAEREELADFMIDRWTKFRNGGQTE